MSPPAHHECSVCLACRGSKYLLNGKRMNKFMREWMSNITYGWLYHPAEHTPPWQDPVFQPPEPEPWVGNLFSSVSLTWSCCSFSWLPFSPKAMAKQKSGKNHLTCKVLQFPSPDFTVFGTILFHILFPTEVTCELVANRIRKWWVGMTSCKFCHLPLVGAHTPGKQRPSGQR